MLQSFTQAKMMVSPQTDSTLAERHATRSKVSNAVITAKAVAKVTEATLWSDAAKNVLEATKNS